MHEPPAQGHFERRGRRGRRRRTLAHTSEGAAARRRARERTGGSWRPAAVLFLLAAVLLPLPRSTLGDDAAPAALRSNVGFNTADLVFGSWAGNLSSALRGISVLCAADRIALRPETLVAAGPEVSRFEYTIAAKTLPTDALPGVVAREIVDAVWNTSNALHATITSQIGALRFIAARTEILIDHGTPSVEDSAPPRGLDAIWRPAQPFPGLDPLLWWIIFGGGGIIVVLFLVGCSLGLFFMCQSKIRRRKNRNYSTDVWY